MIKRFRHKGLERLFTRGSAHGVDPQFAAKLRRMLKVLSDSREPQGMNLPGYRLHSAAIAKDNGRFACRAIGVSSLLSKAKTRRTSILSIIIDRRKG